jgi:hypothetical protein
MFMGYLVPVLAALTLPFSPNGFFRTPAKSAGDMLYAAFDVDKLGKFPRAVYLGGRAPEAISEEAGDTAKQKQLWKETLGLVNIAEGETALKDWA